MPNRIAMGAATWWDSVVAVILTLATIAGLVVLGGRVYTRAILRTGATLSLGEAWRSPALPPHLEAAATTAATKRREVRAPMRPTARDTRTQLVPTVIAIAVGAVVAVTVGDVVIGVGVGAAVFALARQGMKVWGPKADRQAGATTESDREPARSGPSRPPS
jgi:hypothetical protein